MASRNAGILQWNCRGVKPNFEEIKCLIADRDPALVCLQETRLDSDKMTIKNYDAYNKTSNSPTDGRAIGGSSIFVKKGMPHEHLQLNSNLQAVAVKVTLHRNITVCSVYVPPSHRLAQDEIDNLVGQLPSPFLLLGDFNGHSDLWTNSDLCDGIVMNDQKGKAMESVLENFDLCLLNDGSPTYLHHATGSLTAIDLSICTPDIFMDFNWKVHEHLCGSDHFPIFIDVIQALPDEQVPKWKLHKANWVEFERLCSASINRQAFVNDDNPLASFMQILSEVATKTVPKSSANPHKKHNPWFNDECRKVTKARNKALKQFRNRPTTHNFNKYKQARAKARKIIKTSKRESWKQYVSKLNTRTPVKKAWEMVRKISGKSLGTTVPHLTKPDGSKCTERYDIASMLADEFQKNSSSTHYPHKFQQYKHDAEKHKLDFASNNMEDYNSPFTIKEIKESLDKCHDTATGPDDVHYQFLKHLSSESLLVLLDIFNRIWETGNFPDSWREATIIPLPKPGKDATNPTNYRPISLTSCLCKTMERMINSRLVWFLEKNGLISKFQSGFRRGRSTIDQLVRLDSAIRDGFIKGHHVVSVFFDLEKAYDTTWKYGIMKDLHKAGLRGKMPIFIQNFLAHRKFRVRLGSETSDLHDQEMGVPQGSILSVTLFSLKINSISKVVKPGIEQSLFVDDFSITCSNSSMEIIERRLQDCLNQIQQWADENGFRFSKTKTVCMHFCNKRSLHPDPELKINGTQIPVVEQTKFLGLIFDNKLNFKAHIDYLRKKCQSSLNLLKVVSKMDWGADRTVMLRLYRALVRSKLDYGCMIYSSARQSYLKKLIPIQNQALRLCLGAFRTSPMQSLYVEANEPPLHLRWEKLSLQYALKLTSNPDNPAYDKAFRSRLQHFYTSKPSAIKSFAFRIKDAFSQVCDNPNEISPRKIPQTPPWKLIKPEIDLSLRSFKKSSTDPLIYQDKFWELREKYPQHIPIYTDGSKDQDKVGAAATCCGLNKQKRLPSNASIYTAELHALKMAFDIALQTPHTHFIIFSDSLSSLTALNGNNDHPYILELRETYSRLVKRGKSIVLAWIPSHIGIKGNEKADALAKEALNINVTNIKIPYSDLKININKYIQNKWQVLWDSFPDNKLHSIQQNVVHSIETLEKRRDDIVITRARIGHTYLTHGYLLRGERIPECIPCNNIVTVKHILLECIDYAHIRQRYFNEPNLGALFANVQKFQIVDFLKEIDLYKHF